MGTVTDTVCNTGYFYHMLSKVKTVETCIIHVTIFVFYCEKAGESHVRQMIFMAFIAAKVLLYVLSLFSFSS